MIKKYLIAGFLLASVFPAQSTKSGSLVSEEEVIEVAAVEDVVTVINEEPDNDDMIYQIVEKAASFPGGKTALREFISKNVQYPVTALDEGISGIVIVSFVITKEGEIKNIEIKRSIRQDLDEEAIRIVKSMPKWIPAEHHGKKVNSKFTIPVSFKLLE